jgi:hypothetical protein
MLVVRKASKSVRGPLFYPPFSLPTSGRQRRTLRGTPRPPWHFRLAAGSIQHADWQLLQAAHTMLLLLAEVRAGIISSTQTRAFLLQDLVDTWLPLRPLSLVSKCVRLFVFGLFLNLWTRSSPDCMYREAGVSWWNMFECRVHSFQSDAQQLAHLPPNTP